MRAENRNRLVQLLAGLTSVSTPQTRPGDYTTYWMLCFNFDADAAGISKDTYLKALQAEGVPVINYAHAFAQARSALADHQRSACDVDREHAPCAGTRRTAG